MPHKQERLWTDEELFGIERTLVNLRRMRTAATCGLEPPKTGIRAYLSTIREFLEGPIPEDRQKVLSDAQNLAGSAGYVFADISTRNGRDAVRQEEWRDLLRQTTEQYARYPTTTFARTRKQAATLSIMGHLKAMTADPEYVLNWDLFRTNNLGSRNVQSLLRRNITVVAALSGDLFMAAIYRAYLDVTRGKSFDLRAAAMDKDLKYFTLPDLSDLALDRKREVGIFLDIVETGKTSRAMLNALRSSYPDLKIHIPRSQRIEYQPNRKIRETLGSSRV